MREAVEIYKTGNGRAAKEKINDAYYGIYEKEGLESTLRVSVSSKSVGLTEYQFYKVKKAMLAGDPLEKVQQEAETLIQMVYENVDALHTDDDTGVKGRFWKQPVEVDIQLHAAQMKNSAIH